MSQTPQLPASARAISAATTDAVTSAGAGDVEAFDEAVSRLAATDPEHVRVVLGAVVRDLLEDQYPDGVSGDDLLERIKNCARTSYGWYPAVDVGVLIVVLTGALGVHEPDQEPRAFTPLDVARHAPLFIAELLPSSSGPSLPADRPLASSSAPSPSLPADQSLQAYFTRAYRDIARSELNDLP